MTIFIPQEKVAKTIKLLQEVIQKLAYGSEVTPRIVAKVAGMICAFSEAFAQAKVVVPSFYSIIHLKENDKHSWDTPLPEIPEIKLLEFLQDAQWVVENLKKFNGRFFGQQLRIFAVHLYVKQRSKIAYEIQNSTSGSLLWPKDVNLISLEQRELVALLTLLKTGLLSKKKVLWRAQSRVAIAALTKKTGSSEMIDLVFQIWETIFEQQIYMCQPIVSFESPEYTRMNLEGASDWSLSQTVFSRINTQLGLLEMDFFASDENRKLKNYITYETDAFTYPWNHHRGYFCVPFALLSKILNKLHQEQAVAVVILPVWPSQTWWKLSKTFEIRSVELNGTDFVAGLSGNIEPLNGNWLIKAALMDFRMYK
jgi:hypothetical protein